MRLFYGIVVNICITTARRAFYGEYVSISNNQFFLLFEFIW